MDLTGIAIGLITVLLALIGWLVKRLAKMRELDDDGPAPGERREGFVDRFRRAHQVVLEEERVTQVAVGFSPVEFAAVEEQRTLEEEARKAAFVDWDYPIRPEDRAELRRILGYVTFFVLWFGLLLSAIFVFSPGDIPGPAGDVAVAATLVLSLLIAFVAAWRIGAWFGINPYEHGYRLGEQGKYRRAEKRLRQALARHPKSLRAGLALADVFLDMDQIEKASECASGLRLHYPDTPLVHEVLARIDHQRGLTSAAAHEYDLAASAAERAGAPNYAQLMRQNADRCRGVAPGDESYEWDDAEDY
jgi:tetratricopeptide (TPR) repeat protein